MLGDPISVVGSPVAGTWGDGWTIYFLGWRKLLAGSATGDAVRVSPVGRQARGRLTIPWAELPGTERSPGHETVSRAPAAVPRGRRDPPGRPAREPSCRPRQR